MSTVPSSQRPIIVRPLQDMYQTLSISGYNNNNLFNYICLIVVTGGQGTHLIDDSLYKLRQGHVAIIMPEQPQQFQPTSRLEGFFIVFEKHTFSCQSQQSLMPNFKLYDKAVHNPVYDCDAESLSLLVTMCQTLMGIMGSRLLESQVTIGGNQLRTVLSIIDTLEAPRENPLQSLGQTNFLTFKRLLQEHLHTTKSTKDYADLMDISPKHLNNMVREAIGVTAKDLINERLIIEIKKGLLEEDQSIEDVSEHLGFQTPSYLTRYFKQHTGMTPLAFKKRRAALQ